MALLPPAQRQKDLLSKEDDKQEDINLLVSMIDKKFTACKDSRQDVHFTEHEKSRVFVKVTKTKVLAAYGQIIDV